jgi:Transposase domain (DUF772)
MRPKKQETTGEGDLFRARLDQIINMEHELVELAGRLDWEHLDEEIAPLYSDKGRPGIATRFVIGLMLLKHIFALSDEEVCERWVYDPYFQYFTGEEFFQHRFPHERSDLSHWRKRLGSKLELLLAESRMTGIGRHPSAFLPNTKHAQYHCPRRAALAKRLASSAARNSALALFTHSCCSAFGLESATMPAPACTYMVPSLTSAVRSTIAVSMSPAAEK